MTTAITFLAIAVAFLAYFAPAIVAGARHLPNAVWIGVLNGLLGWTVFGWVAALIMALKPKPQPYPPWPANQALRR